MLGADFTGLAGLLQSLTRTSRVKDAAKRSLEAEAGRLVEAIKAAAPVDDGSLRDSVRVEPGKDELTVIVTAGGDPENLKRSKGGEFDEALMIEFGTSRSPAQPFVHPTVNAMRDEIKANVGSALSKES